MTLLEFSFIVAGIIIFITALDIITKRKFNTLHFFIFIGIGIALFLMTVFPDILNLIGRIFGVARGADVLVYASILFLIYFSLVVYKKTVESEDSLTDLVRELALDNSDKREIVGDEVFVIPVYNEEQVAIETVNSVLSAGYKNIIVVNDGSKDKSGRLLKTLKDKIVVLHHLKNRGQGAALETGFEYIRRYGDVKNVITFDSDGQHKIEEYKVFKEYIEKNKDVEMFLGSRFLKENKIPFGRKIILKLGILFTLMVSGIKLSDVHNGYRVLRVSALDKIKIKQDGMSHSSEILDIISAKKIKYIEVPVTITYSEYSVGKGQKSSNAINIALKTIWNKFFR